MKKLLAFGTLMAMGLASAAVAVNQAREPAAATSTTIARAAKAEEVNPLLAYVPDDSVFFSGGLSPLSFDEIVSLSQTAGWRIVEPEERQTLEQSLADIDLPAARMLAGIFLELANIEQLDAIPEHLGLRESFNYAFYAVGAAPVLRLELTDTAAFNDFITSVEQRHDLTPIMVSNDTLSYRRYLLLENDDPKDSWYLGIGVHDGVASVFLDSHELGGAELVDLALGVQQPELSVASTKRLQHMMHEHGFLPDSIAYIDHKEIARAITDADGNRLSRVLNKPTSGANQNATAWVQELRTDACQKDLMGIADAWPRTSMGYTQLDFSGPTVVEASVIVESTDHRTMQALSQLRGHVPAHLSNTSTGMPLGLALGLNAERLGPFIQQTWQRLVGADYSCTPLQAWQTQLRASNPAMLSLMMAMASGLKGVSASIQALEFNTVDSSKAPALTNLSTLLTVSADDPLSAFSIIQSLTPYLEGIQISADGTPAPLPTLNGIEINDKPVTPMIALRGSHIALYIGAEAESIAHALNQDALKTNGFLSMDFDHSRYHSLIDSLLLLDSFTDPDQAQTLGEFSAALAATSGLRSRFGLDFTEKGIVMRSRITQDLAE